MNRFFLVGYMGSGKTSMGKLLADKLGYTFVDMDARIEEKYLKTVSDIFAEMGQDKFREMERDCLHEVATFENVVISTGGGAPCFFDNMDYMNHHGITVYLNLSIPQLVERLSSSRPGKRPLIDGLKGEYLEQFIVDALAIRQPFYSKAQIHISGTDEEMVEKITSIKAL